MLAPPDCQHTVKIREPAIVRLAVGLRPRWREGKHSAHLPEREQSATPQNGVCVGRVLEAHVKGVPQGPTRPLGPKCVAEQHCIGPLLGLHLPEEKE